MRKHLRGVLTTTVVLVGCGTPDQNTDLRPAGPPEVLAVLVGTDPSAQLVESATFCAPNDAKRPTSVGLPDFSFVRVCDDDPAVEAAMVDNAYPDGWYIRIMFDELLDPSVEELVEIMDPDTGMGTDTFFGTLVNTQPVTLQCESISGGMVDVPYDGYYSPSGNSVTWPLGPSLVIKPDEPRAIATSSMCTVSVKDRVRDKGGDPVPAEQRGPYPFKVAPLQIVAIEPADGSEVTPISIYFDNFLVQFNTEVDETSFCDEGVTMDECEFEIVGLGSTPQDYYFYNIAAALGGGILTDSGVTEFGLGPVDPLEAEKTDYKFQFRQGTSLADRCGRATMFGAPSAGDNTLVEFATSEFALQTTAPGTGDTASSLRKLSVQFTNVLDPTSLDAAEFTLTPAVNSVAVGTSPGNDGDFLFTGHYQPGTMYTFTLNAGATIVDARGAVYTQTAARTVSWTTQPIAVTGTSPANNGTALRAMDTSNTTFSISFNQSMDPTTLDPATEITVTGPSTVTFAAPTISGCAPTSTSCSLRMTTTAPIMAGEYTLTLKAGATVTDVLGNVYTQAADRIVNFTVATADPATPPIVCL
ncbi:MAG: Ig-like domain-containing protein [Kofleriaceae bacterium]